MESSAATQLVLPFGVRQDLSFDNYLGETNARTAVLLHQALDDPEQAYVYLQGSKESGKTHLSIAALGYLEDAGLAVFYLSFDAMQGMSPGQFEGMLSCVAGNALVILEDFHALFGQPESDAMREMEVAMFDLFNALKLQGVKLLITSDRSVDQLELALPDLISRLKSGLTLRLEPPSESDKMAILKQAARTRGLEISEDVMRFVMTRSSRSLEDLLNVLSDLDRAAWTQKHKLTVPLVKRVMGW